MISYDRDYYNCAHHAVSIFNDVHNLSIDIKDKDAWQASFVPFLRSELSSLDRPIENCLVVMSLKCGGLHLGIYRNFAVEHNYNAGKSGCVIISDMGTIRSEFSRVRFYAPRKTIQR